jgi:hypothetical protein
MKLLSKIVSPASAADNACASVAANSLIHAKAEILPYIKPSGLAFAADAAKLIDAPKGDRRDTREANMRRGLV